MEKPLKGDVVVIPFPFSDLAGSKRRPALVLASLKGDDLILCQITSRSISDENAIAIESGDFAKGGLNLPSNIRPNRLFTADRSIVLEVAGQVRTDVFAKAVDAVVAILRS